MIIKFSTTCIALFTHPSISLSLFWLSQPVSLSFRARVRAHHVSHADGLRGMHQAAVATVQAAGGVRMQEVSNERQRQQQIERDGI